MNWKCYLGCISLFVFGMLTGAAMNNNKYLAGRLSACKDLTIVIMQDPILAMATGGVTCVEQANDVFISINNAPNKLYKLNGEAK